MSSKPRTVLQLAFFAGVLTSKLHAADTQLNATFSQDQERVAAAQLANGTLVFVFEDESVTNGQVFLRRFNTNLVAISGEQRVNASTMGERREPVVAALTGGGFVVAYSAGGLDGSNYGVAFRRFDANATALDPNDVQANTITAASQFLPQVAALANDGFVIAWIGQSGGAGQDVFYRRFASNGSALDGADVRANSLGNDPVTAGDQGCPRVAALSDGGFVIVYEDRATEDLYGVRISSAGGALDAPGEAAGNKQFRVNASLPHNQNAPAVAALTNGGFVVTYNSETNGTAGSRRVLARLFSSAGVGGSAFQIGSHSNRWQDSRVTGLRNGDFVVAWQARGEGVDAGTNAGSVFEQRFSPEGAPRFSPFMVNTHNANHQNRPGIAAFQSSGYVIAWESAGQDGSGYGIFGRAFLPNNEIPGYLTITSFPITGNIAVSFTGQPGRDHQLQRSANLTSWASVLTTNPATGTFQYTEPRTNAPRFFRVQSL